MAPELRSQLGTYLRSQIGTYFMEQGSGDEGGTGAGLIRASWRRRQWRCTQTIPSTTLGFRSFVSQLCLELVLNYALVLTSSISQNWLTPLFWMARLQTESV